MANREAVYLKLPVALQNTLCYVEGLRIQRTRYDRRFLDLLRDAEKRTYWTADRIRDYRDKRLHAFVQHCAMTVPYYRRAFQEHGISPDQIQTLADLQRLPVLTKKQVQEHSPELVSEGVPKDQQIVTHTSGTTGGGLRFAITQRATQEQWAIWWRYRHWHGLQFDTLCGYFGGRSVVSLAQTKPPFWRYNSPGHQVLFSAYHMSVDNLQAYVNELRRKRPPWLHGYPSLLALLAAYIVEKNIDLGYAVRWITIGAENLLRQQADMIQRAFGVKPVQHYGMAEAVANVSECDQGKLHVDEDFAAVEFLPNESGSSYRVIGTNFTNPATPLLRYDVQDTVTLSTESCWCGRPGRIIDQVDGRQEDYVVLKNGSRLGRMDHVFKDMTNIREAQIYQKRPGEMIIRIVRGNHYSQSDEDSLQLEVRKRVGDQADISFEYVDDLSRSRTGKLRFVVSEIREGQLETIGR